MSFHSDRNVKKYVVLERDKETLRRLNKTMEERRVAGCVRVRRVAPACASVRRWRGETCASAS